MYYIKHNSEKIELYGDKIFGTCPICGKEINIELDDTIGDDGRIRFDSDTFCDSCTEHKYTKKYVESVNDGTWDDFNALALVEDEKIHEQLKRDDFQVVVCPVTGELLINDDSGTECSLAAYISIIHRNGIIEVKV